MLNNILLYYSMLIDICNIFFYYSVVSNVGDKYK